jgi:hypothetical protein
MAGKEETLKEVAGCRVEVFFLLETGNGELVTI